MARGHPVDAHGRVLPDCAWPADKAAPDGLEIIRRFCNTYNCENGADQFETVAGLRRWLDGQGLLDAGLDVADSDRQLLGDVREHLRAHALAHHDGIDVAGGSVPLASWVAEVPVALDVDGPRLTIRPTGGDVVSRTVGVLALAVMESQRSDRWRRFKACPRCGWVFYDRSKNASGRWCSMSACGGRAKVAAFRERQREAVT